MKRRKFGTAAIFLSALLIVAFAAASVNAAGSAVPKRTKISAHTFKTNKPTTTTFRAGAVGGQTTNKASKPTDRQVIQSRLHNLQVNKSKGGVNTAGAALAGPPNGPNLPFTGAGSGIFKEGINAWLNNAVNGLDDPDPSPAICQGPGTGKVIQVTENTLQIQDTGYVTNHAQNAESLYLFFYQALQIQDNIILDHPHCYFDSGTRHWFVAVDSFDINTGESAVLVAVSVLSDPVGTWYLYFFDTSVDGNGDSCWGGNCYGNLRGLGANKNALVISVDEWSSFNILGHLPNQSPQWSTNGATLIVADLTGMALGLPIFAATADPGDVGYYGLMPAQSPNGNWNFAHGGTAFLVDSYDPAGGLSNWIDLWAVTGTGSISFNPTALVFSVTTINGGAGMNTWFGLPVTDTNCSNVNLAYFVLNTITCVDQPPYGPIPLGDDLGFGYGSIPRPINAGDDSVADAKAVTIPNKGPSTIAFVLTTKTIVQDSVHVNHLRAGTYVAFIHPTGWDVDDRTILSAAEDSSSIISNANNSFIFPSIALATNGTRAVVVNTLTGNAHYPSAAYAKVQIHHPATVVNIALEGQAPYDGFFQYPVFWDGFRPFALLFFGEYSSATADGSTVYFTQEYIQGGQRSYFENWSASLGKVNA